jgi:hypothetical protein
MSSGCPDRAEDKRRVLAVKRWTLALAVARLAFATSAVVAMSYMLGTLQDLPGFRVGNYFSFFTIQTNMLAAATLALAAIVRRDERSLLFDAVRGAVTLYIAITGVVFALLLSGRQEDLDTHIGWVNFVVHTLTPIVLVVDWLLEPARQPLARRIALAWLAYPVAWFAYTLVRGAAEDWYPYPFVDVGSHGYARVLLNAVLLGACFLGGALLFLFVGNRRAGVPEAPHRPEAAPV